MKKNQIGILVFFIALLSYPAKAQSSVNPLDYGLRLAKTGTERYEVMLKCHKDAIERGLNISYAGIDTVNLEIPKGAKSIPLPEKTDFSDAVIIVLNKAENHFFLFKLSQKVNKIQVDKKLIDSGDFRSVKDLKDGQKLLIIEDRNLWVDNRVGYSYGVTRKDILLLRNGRSINKVIAPYNNAESDPVLKYCDVSDKQKVIRNLTIIRDSLSTLKMFPIKVENQNNVLLENITLVTPPNPFYADSAIKINDSANVTFRNIKSTGSYSQKNKYGYIFSLNNLWNTLFDHVDADAIWGVMGTYNMSDTVLKNCVINRFDIHCYGRNVLLADCTIRKSERAWYCGGSSIYGTIRYDRCTFYNTSPYANGDSFKTYVPNDVIFNDCVFEVTKRKYSIVSTANFNNDLNPRKGLEQKCLPNLTINNMKIIVPIGVRQVYLFNLGKEVSYKGKVGNLRKVYINGLELICEDEKNLAKLKFSTAAINTESEVQYTIRNFSVSAK